MCVSVVDPSCCVIYLFVLAFISLLSNATASLNNIEPQHERLRRQTSCGLLKWKCSNGQCISSYSLCDGTRDCKDGSDETRSRCSGVRCLSQSFRCSYGACIDHELKCDGKSDCADGSDEQGCSTASSACRPGNFRCSDGQCIDQYELCDGVTNCNDGSDETRELCKDIKCLSNNFQCDYGACLEGSVKCNGRRDCPDGSDEFGCQGNPTPSTTTPKYNKPTLPTVPGQSCLLPEHPTNGVYTSVLCSPGDSGAACRNLPGTPVASNWLLKYSCHANYRLTSSDSEHSVCENGVWKNPLDCIKQCPPLRSLSVDIRCEYGGREVLCDQPMKPDTRAVAKCKQHYREIYKPPYSSLLCLASGEWSYPLFYCTPDCGVSTTSETLVAQILNGSETHQGEFPWLAALYLRSGVNQWDQKCGGTLISPHIVLTAAHCLVLSEGTVTPQNIKVGLGKYYRDFNKYENYSVIAEVREIVTPAHYSGLATFYALDIALLDLAHSVQVTAFIMPACVDWTSTFTLTLGNIGHVAGWGLTENGTSSDTILSSQLSYIDNVSCIKRVKQLSQRVTHDKFCAGSVNGSLVDKGDSGGGLTFVKNGQHYVFGIVSTKIVDEKSFSLFTDISNPEHHAWLENHRTRLDRLHRET